MIQSLPARAVMHKNTGKNPERGDRHPERRQEVSDQIAQRYQ
jgi:hypothetical protein